MRDLIRVDGSIRSDFRPAFFSFFLFDSIRFDSIQSFLLREEDIFIKSISSFISLDRGLNLFLRFEY